MNPIQARQQGYEARRDWEDHLGRLPDNPYNREHHPGLWQAWCEGWDAEQCPDDFG